MKFISVWPLTRAPLKEALSYFTAQPIAVGAIVRVSLRGTGAPAIVTTVTAAETHRSALRRATFELRKVDRVLAPRFFDPDFVAAVEETANYFVAPLGAVLRLFVPEAILAALSRGGIGIRRPTSKNESRPNAEKLVVQLPDTERLGLYRSIVRGAFARGGSVLITVPRSTAVSALATEIRKGIDDRVFELRVDTPAREQVRVWNQILAATHPIVIVTTPAGAGINRTDLDTIIIDQESDDGYKRFVRPYLDARHTLETYATLKRLHLYLGAEIIRVETFSRTSRGELAPAGSLSHHLETDARCDIIDTSTIDDGSVIAPALRSVLEKCRDEGRTSFFLAGRRGTFPITMCRDCGTIIRCPECQAPLVMHSDTSSRRFVCHHCAYAGAVRDACPSCGGWRVTPYGIGLERIVAEMKATVPGLKVLALSSDTARSRKSAATMTKRFFATPGGGVIVGTELGLAELPDTLDYTGVIGIDAMFSLPEFRIRERLLRLLVALRHRARHVFYIHTRTPNEPTFQYVHTGSLLDFYREELNERERFGYPPVTTLIKVSVAVAPTAVTATEKYFEQRFAGHELALLTGPGDRPRRVGVHAILRVPAGTWPLPALLERLRELPPQVTVEVEPESIL